MMLTDKVAVVTGAASGLGNAIARRFVDEGALVCMVDINEEALMQAKGKLPQDRVVACKADVSSPSDVKAVAEAALGFGKDISILVNCAGRDDVPAPCVDYGLDQWDRALDVNLTGPLLLMKECIPAMQRRQGGSIINIASLAALRALPGNVGYCATKAALVHLSKQVALDYGKDNIRCNAICPGAFRTPMLTGNIEMFSKQKGIDVEEGFKLFSQDTPLKRVANPDEISGLCTFLASDDSSFITGAVIPIDGGASIVDASGAAIND